MQRVIKDSDAAIEKKQARCGTYLYVFLMVVVSAGICANQFLKTEVEVVEVTQPTLAEVQKLREQGYKPVCPCSSPTNSYAAFAELTYKSSKVCPDTGQLLQRCLAHYKDAAAKTWCNGIEPSFAVPVFAGVITLCNASRLSAEQSVFNMATESLVTPALIPPDDLEARVQHQVERSRRNAVRSIVAPLAVIDSVNQIERPVTAVTLGPEIQRDPSSKEPYTSAQQWRASGHSQRSQMGFAFQFAPQQIPGTGLECDCYRNWRCHKPVDASTVGGLSGVVMTCSLFATVESFPIEGFALPNRRRERMLEAMRRGETVDLSVGLSTEGRRRVLAQLPLPAEARRARAQEQGHASDGAAGDEAAYEAQVPSDADADANAEAEAEVEAEAPLTELSLSFADRTWAPWLEAEPSRLAERQRRRTLARQQQELQLQQEHGQQQQQAQRAARGLQLLGDVRNNVGGVLKGGVGGGTVTSGDAYCCQDVDNYCVNDFSCFWRKDCCAPYRATAGLKAGSDEATARKAFEEGRKVTTGPMSGLIAEGFIDVYEAKASFTQYYEACKPLTCSYVRTVKQNGWTIGEALLGFIGGVSVFIKAAVTGCLYITPKSCFGRHARDAAIEMGPPSSSGGHRGGRGGGHAGGGGAVHDFVGTNPAHAVA